MKTILITGASGFIGGYLVSKLKYKYRIIGTDIDKSSYNKCEYFYNNDITDKYKINEIFNNHKIDYVIHTAAEKSLINCENNKKRAYEVNYLASEVLYNICKERNVKFIFISSDQVFDGSTGNYNENAETNPINYYGKLKKLFEDRIKNDENISICRTALTFGEIPKNQQSYFEQIKKNDHLVVQSYIVQHVIYKLLNKEEIILPQNEYINPTSIELLYNQISKVIETNATGILHCCGGEKISRYEFGKKIAMIFKLDDSFIKPNNSNDKLRPKDVSLNIDHSSSLLGISFLDIDMMLNSLKDKIDIEIMI